MEGFIPWWGKQTLRTKNILKKQKSNLVLNVLFKEFKEIAYLRCMLLCSSLCLHVFVPQNPFYLLEFYKKHLISLKFAKVGIEESRGRRREFVRNLTEVIKKNMIESKKGTE